MNEILTISSSTNISYSGGGIEVAFIFLGILGIVLLALIIAALISIISISKSIKDLVNLEYKKYENEYTPRNKQPQTQQYRLTPPKNPKDYISP